jgi:hypothetical protein
MTGRACAIFLTSPRHRPSPVPSKGLTNAPAISPVRCPTDTVPSRRRDFGVDVRAQRIFASLPGGRRKATVRRDLGVHLLARGKMNSRFLRTGLGEAN